MQNVEYDTDWQKMRVSFLAEHSTTGGFTSEAGTDDNLRRLNQYILWPLKGDLKDHKEYACRVWRAINLLNAVHMGYSGQGKSGHPEDQAVLRYRETLQPHYDPHTVQEVDMRWDWEEQRQKLERMWVDEVYWFKAIKDDLKRRARVAHKRAQRGGFEVETTRPELLFFLDMMERIDKTRPGEVLPGEFPQRPSTDQGTRGL